MDVVKKKLIVVGDDGSGKESIPRVHDNFWTTIPTDEHQISLQSWDTPCQSGADEYRARMYYSGTHVILICFAIDSPKSLEHVKEKWSREIKQLTHGRPFLLVGCKKDLRTEYPDSVSFDEGTVVALDIGATHYMECSAKDNDGVNEVFEQAARVAFQNDNPKCLGGRCVVQ